ncbi:MAG TPA: MFS transporter [Candidatus Saccharibacteria bacterium]|nr:MFS transporter [Candidatus Saccharibacteria bacterium]HMT55740.1 MFS transporter [Candidatus Saccharibacteria bacterium]
MKNSARSLNEKEVIHKRLKPLYYAAFFQGVIFWFSIEKLFLSEIGFSKQLIAISVIIFSGVNFISNFPIGILADRWSRTGVLMISSISMAVASLAGAISNSFWPYVITLVLSSFAMASSAGAYDSIVYDMLKENSINPTYFNSYYARLRVYDGLALVFGSIVSSLIVSVISLEAAYYLTAPFSLASLVLLKMFKEPTEHHSSRGKKLLHHVNETLNAVSKNKTVLTISLNIIIASIISSIILGFGQLWFIALTVPLALYGPFDGMLLSSFTLGGVLRERLHSNKAVAFLAIILLFASIVMFFRNAYVIVLAQTTILVVLMYFKITFEELLHQNLKSNVRAGAASLVSTASSAIFLLFAFLIGKVSDSSSIFNVAWIILGLVLTLLITGFRHERHLKRKQPLA